MLSFFFFNDTATTEIYTLSLHDALPISLAEPRALALARGERGAGALGDHAPLLLGERGVDVQHKGVHVGPRVRSPGDRKSTRLNSSHANISYAVFCLKKKKTQQYVS